MKWIATLMACISTAYAQDLTKERIWTGTNGKSFRGIFIRSLPESKKVEIGSSAGKTFTVALENLSEPDRKFIEAGLATPTESKKELPTTEFKPIPPTQRQFISQAPGKDVGFDWPNSITQAIGSYFFWWDRSKIIEIPRRGDAVRKCDWVTDKLKRKISPRNSKLESHNEVMEGIAYYFENELDDIATCRFHLVVAPTPERIAEFTQAADACLIRIHNDGWGIWLPIIDVMPNDIIRVSYEGKILMLKWTPSSGGRTSYTEFTIPVPGSEPIKWNPFIDYIKANRIKPTDIKTPSLVVMNKNDVPSHWEGDELEFTMSPDNPMIVCRPFVYADAEKPGAPVLDPGFGPPAGKK